MSKITFFLLTFLLLSAAAATTTSDEDEQQAEHLRKRDLRRSSQVKPATQMVMSMDTAQTQLITHQKSLIAGQKPYKFCTVGPKFEQTNCAIAFPNPTKNALITPIVFPYPNPANNFQQCWGISRGPAWQCGGSWPSILGPANYGNYPNTYVGSYLEFPPGHVEALQTDAKSASARDSIIAVMEEFVYTAVAKIIVPADGSNRYEGAMLQSRCGFPNSLVFGCSTQTPLYNNPQVNFGVAPDGSVRLLVIFVVDWSTITGASQGRFKTFHEYASWVSRFFDGANNAAHLWTAALNKVGAGSSKFLSGAARGRPVVKKAGASIVTTLK